MNYQHRLKVEQYCGLAGHLRNAANAQVGYTVILPSPFQGSPRNMHECYQDTMAIVCIYDPPVIFLTITCNPNWQEIRENLLPGQTLSDRPDLVVHIFSIKLHELLNDITKKHLFGQVTAYCFTIEFQKKGLPHAHLLIILHPDDKLDDL
uniref:Helitron helicase-like domain-containing protein n=1 Tax=Octopus bimaculoides TaxID=37653 RepID=A0A0L8HR92_OCTBM